VTPGLAVTQAARQDGRRNGVLQTDRALMREMGEMGFIAPELPERFGGLGLGCLTAGVIHEEIARADLSISGGFKFRNEQRR